MTGSPELLEFYLVEATEYLDALDQLVAGTGAPPDGNAFIATARALRGASSMAKVAPIEQIASLIEQLAHGVRDGDLRWTVDLHRVLRLTVDDLRFLVRGVRTWGEREAARADARLADLQRCLPNEERRSAAPDAAATAPVFIALQSSAIAAELDAFVANPRHKRALDDALTRARTMRGIAGIGDFPPLADVADAIDRTARALMPDAPLAEGEIELFRSAADVLRQTSARLRDGGDTAPDEPMVARFARAVTALEVPAPVAEGERVVAIDELYYADAGPHVLQRAAAPPSTRMQRFRAEVTSRAEHLRRLVNDARQVHDLAGRERAERGLRGALLDMESVAGSFDVHQVAAFFGETAREIDLLAPSPLEAIEAGALLLLAPGDSDRGDRTAAGGAGALATQHAGDVAGHPAAPRGRGATGPHTGAPGRSVARGAAGRERPVYRRPRRSPGRRVRPACAAGAEGRPARSGGAGGSGCGTARQTGAATSRGRDAPHGAQSPGCDRRPTPSADADRPGAAGPVAGGDRRLQLAR